MLPRSALNGALDAASRSLSAQFKDHVANIAQVGGRIRERIQEATTHEDTLESPAALFALCGILDSDPLCKIDSPVVNAHALRLRQSALKTLLEQHYEAECRQSPEAIRDLLREQTIAICIAEHLPLLRQKLPIGRFGPGTLQELLDSESYQELEEYAYDLDGDRLDWSRMTRLLPSDLSERFDAAENGIEIPERITSVEQALSLLRQISERRGISLEEFADPNLMVRFDKEVHGFAEIVEYLRDVERSDTSDPS